MKLKFDIKNKKGEFEADVEKIVEKGMDQHDKNWKDKFNTKHNAKKEMLEIKHKQKMEVEEKHSLKKSWIEKIQEEKRKKRELELEEKRRQAEEKKKVTILKIIFSVILGVVGLVMMVVGSILGAESGDPNSGWHAMSVFGFFPLLSVAFIWIPFSENNKKK